MYMYIFITHNHHFDFVTGPTVTAFIVDGTDEDMEGDWQFSTTFNFEEPHIVWAEGQNDGGTAQNCFNFHKTGGTFSDAACQTIHNNYAVICEKDGEKNAMKILENQNMTINNSIYMYSI